jgi:hypothetical protein
MKKKMTKINVQHRDQLQLLEGGRRRRKEHTQNENEIMRDTRMMGIYFIK